ncbi:MAG: porin family protein [Chitinophagaceae bacterium]
MKKQIKRLFNIAIFLLIAQTSFAQISLGVKGGISIPNLKAPSGSNPVSSGWSSRQGPYFGVFSEFKISDHFALQLELNYSSQGGKKDGVQGIATSDFFAPNPVPPGAPKYVYASFKNEAALNYIELPLLAKIIFPLGEKFSFFIDGGPYAGYLLKAKNISSGSSMVYLDKAETQPLPIGTQSFDSTADVTKNIKRFNAGIQGGIGIAVKLGNGELMLTGGGNYGLINIQKNADDGKNNTGAATVTLGYLIRL